jgi:hypothetical protein
MLTEATQLAVQQPTITQQVLAWVNGLTLPGIAFTAFMASRWLTKKEDEARAVVAEALAKVEQIRTNDLHHIQTTLTDMKDSAQRHYDSEERHQEDLVAAMNSSKDAIVNAIISTRT